MVRSWRRPWLGGYCTFIHGGEASVAQGCAGWDQRRRHSLAVVSTGVDRDTAGIDALLRNQVCLGVDGTLSSELIALLLCAVLIANHSQLRIGGALQVESDIVQAGLGFVIYTSRPLLVAIEVDRAELAGRRCWRRRRCIHRNRRRARCTLTLIINHVRSHRDCSWRCTCRGQRGGRSVSSNRSSRRAVAVGQRTILRADAGCGNRRR